MNIDICLEKLQQKKEYLDEININQVCEKVKEILSQEDNLLIIDTPVTICGDIHGQYYDLLELFKLAGNVQDNKFCFLGDYVDRGQMSVETFSLLLCLKIKYPQNIYLIRGNHESSEITLQYGFYDECIKKYGNDRVYQMFLQVFQFLPLSCIIDGEIFGIHGGLSPDITEIDQIRLIDRCREIPDKGSFADLIWSDPNESNGFRISQRGAGFLFGPDVTKYFMHLNNLSLICRAHQLVQEGYKYWFENDSLITVWSAPNYLNRMKNVASFLKINDNLQRDITIFEHVEESTKMAKQYKNLLPYFL